VITHKVRREERPEVAATERCPKAAAALARPGRPDSVA
jgi:hypothetical protein